MKKFILFSMLIATARGGYQHEHWSELRNIQRTRVAVSDGIRGPWKRSNQPMIEPLEPLHTLTVNPAVASMPDGRFLLMIKPASGSMHAFMPIPTLE